VPISTRGSSQIGRPLDPQTLTGFLDAFAGFERRTERGRRAHDLSIDQQASIAQAIVLFADARREGRGEADTLQLLIDVCRVLVHDAEVSVIARQGDGELRVLASSSEVIDVVDELQLSARAGPTLEALEDGGHVVDVSLLDERLPGQFRTVAMLAGLRRQRAVPLDTGHGVIGVLNLYTVHDEELAPSLIAWISALAYTAALSIDSMRSAAELTKMAGQLQVALTSRVVIEQAKGLVAAKLDVAPDDAFTLLRRYARSYNRPIRDVCSEVITSRLPAAELRHARQRSNAAGRSATQRSR
jgi:hypothetical protein